MKKRGNMNIKKIEYYKKKKELSRWNKKHLLIFKGYQLVEKEKTLT